MTVRGLLVCAGLWAAVLPATAMANVPPVIDSFGVSGAPIPSSSSVNISCAATDPDGAVNRLTVTVSGGTLAGGGTAADLAIVPGASASGTIVWATPAAGAYTVTCTATDNGLFGGRGTTSSLGVQVVDLAGPVPVLDALQAASTDVVPGQAVRVVAAAHDPAGGPLTWAWSASGGATTGAGDAATWTAPQVPGAYSVTVTVTSGAGVTATGSVQLRVEAKRFAGSLARRGVSPLRIAPAAGGDFLVVDAQGQTLTLLTALGAVKGVFPMPEPALSVAACFGQFFAAGQSGRLYGFDAQGRPQGEFVLADGPAQRPQGMACDSGRGLLYIAEQRVNRVRAVWPDGTTAFAHTQAGADGLAAPLDVAVDPETRRLLVLLESYQAGAQLQVRAFSLDGAYLGAMVPFGVSAGQLTYGAGLAVGSGGQFFVADSFQGVVQAFDAAGGSLGVLGTFGVGDGQLQQPTGLAVTPRGDVVVANTGGARLDLFGTSGPVPACVHDADCDGLPDAWEVANGLNPYDPRDALADQDGDGLTSAQEFALGTNPRNRDTDGDGYTDGEEYLAGFNPLNPSDHLPVLVDRGPVSSLPGLVQLDTLIEARGTCGVTWTQVAGPAVTLRNAATPTPSFVARAAGAYQFRGTPTCGAVVGLPVTVTAEVMEAPPRAVAGPLLVVQTGDRLLLEGWASWDPNGGALSATWEQTLGAPMLGTTPASEAWVRASRPGLAVFSLAARDAVGLTTTTEVPVLVVDGRRPAPTAMAASPVVGEAGADLLLDASASQGAAGAALRFEWRQVLGGAATVSPTADPARMTMQATVPGHYRFEVTAIDGAVRSPAERVDVYVAPAGQALPVASALRTRLSGPVGEPLTLNGQPSRSASGASLAYRWRQLSGPATGLTHDQEARATVVPFVAGTSVFELVVFDGLVESQPTWVQVQASVGGRSVPVAVAEAPAVGQVGQELVLEAGSSTSDPGTRLRYRWAQTSGPWTPLEDPRGRQSAFTPRLPGLYTFSLEVDDGALHSTPATVGVLVFPAASNGGRP